MSGQAGSEETRTSAGGGLEPRRCPACRTKIVVPDPAGVLVRNAILRVSADTGHASAKCPRCKTWVEVPLRYSGH